MRRGQFYKGMINGIEATYETPDLFQILPANKLTQLWDREKIGVYRQIFLSERVITQTLIEKAEPDEHGRDGIVNHTVLYKFDGVHEHEGAIYNFDPDKFASDARLGKYNFTMPPTPELKRPLDLPPSLETLLCK